MGQSFLTHDEQKSSGSPSPDLLQFNGATNPKFFGSLSSVKESSTSSRSPLLESVDSEDRHHNVTSCSSASSTSARIPLSSPSTINESDIYSSLVPTPILPGNVSRLREKFMNESRHKSRRFDIIDAERNLRNAIYRDGNACGNDEVLSEAECRYISRSAATSPVRNSRGGTLPATRSRSSMSALNPVSSSCGTTKRKIRTLPPPSSSSAYDEKLNLIRPDNDLSECFRKMELVGSCSNNNMGSFSNEIRRTSLRRTRPYVPPPRSVIIRAGYLPLVQTVDRKPSRAGRASASASQVPSSSSSPPFPREEQDAMNKCNSESVVTTARTSASIPQLHRKEELRLVSSTSSPSSSSAYPLEAEKRKAHVVTKHEDHRKKKVLTRDAGVNTSAEVLIIPKGTKTSVLLKSGIVDEVDGAKGLIRRRRKKKRGIRRVTRAFGRIMIRLVELF